MSFQKKSFLTPTHALGKIALFAISPAKRNRIKHEFLTVQRRDGVNKYGIVVAIAKEVWQALQDKGVGK